MKLKGEIDKSKIIAGDFNTPLSIITRASKGKLVRQELNKTINSFDPINILTTVEYTLFLNTHGTFIKVDYILSL